MLAKCLRCRHFRRERFNILSLKLVDGSKHVTRPLFDERHERAMAKRSIGTAEGEMVGESRYTNAEIACQAFL